MDDHALSPLEKKVLNIVKECFLNDCSDCGSRFSKEIKVIAKETTPYYSFLYLNKQQGDVSRLPQGAVLEVRLFQKGKAPLQCLLHVKKDAPYVIEIFCADSSIVPADFEMERYEMIDMPAK